MQNMQPFEYLDSDGNLTGFDYELLEAIAQEENLELEWKDMPFDSLVGSMETGNIQIIAAAIGPTKEREKSVDFSDVYYTGSQSIVSSQKTPLYDFAGLSGKRVAVWKDPRVISLYPERIQTMVLLKMQQLSALKTLQVQ